MAQLEHKLTGSGRHPDSHPSAKLCLINGGVSGSPKEERALPRERGEGWAEATPDVPALPLTCRGGMCELTSELTQPKVLFPFVLVLFFLPDSVPVLQGLVEKDMTVGSLSLGSLHGGEL